MCDQINIFHKKLLFQETISLSKNKHFLICLRSELCMVEWTRRPYLSYFGIHRQTLFGNVEGKKKFEFVKVKKSFK